MDLCGHWAALCGQLHNQHDKMLLVLEDPALFDEGLDSVGLSALPLLVWLGFHGLLPLLVLTGAIGCALLGRVVSMA